MRYRQKLRKVEYGLSKHVRVDFLNRVLETL